MNLLYEQSQLYEMIDKLDISYAYLLLFQVIIYFNRIIIVRYCIWHLYRHLAFTYLLHLSFCFHHLYHKFESQFFHVHVDLLVI